MLTPFLLTPAYRHGAATPWGGTALAELFGKPVPDDRTGESLEASALPDLESRGPDGHTLSELIAIHGAALYGTALDASFSLLLKLIDARDTLSVQVHPDDAYARTHENGKRGKTEAWVILAAQPGAQLVYGLVPGMDSDMLDKAARGGAQIADCLRRVYVHPGDVFYIPAGMVHAIGAGIVLYEIQQSSDVTYRFWDWNRRDARGNLRPLHIEEALDVVRPCLWYKDLAGTTLACAGGSRTLFIADDHFALERLSVEDKLRQSQNGLRYALLTALGTGRLQWEGGVLPFQAGQTMFIPATAPAFDIVGPCDMLKAYVPDRRELLGLLSREQAQQVAGLLDDAPHPV